MVAVMARRRAVMAEIRMGLAVIGASVIGPGIIVVIRGGLIVIAAALVGRRIITTALIGRAIGAVARIRRRTIVAATLIRLNGKAVAMVGLAVAALMRMAGIAVALIGLAGIATVSRRLCRGRLGAVIIGIGIGLTGRRARVIGNGHIVIAFHATGIAGVIIGP